LINSLAPAGVNATRFSLFLISFGTPMIMIEKWRKDRRLV